MPIYEFYCSHCHGIFEEMRQMREASLPADCPECSREVPRIMSTFQGFVFRDGYPRRLPDKGTYWHMGREVKKLATVMKDNTHPELAEPKPRPRQLKGDAKANIDRRLADREDMLYKDRWGVQKDGRRAMKAKVVKPERKVITK
ncbi:MAG: zinc ribbon domain-containing protein [Chloroflexota bacterium]